MKKKTSSSTATAVQVKYGLCRPMAGGVKKPKSRSPAGMGSGTEGLR